MVSMLPFSLPCTFLHHALNFIKSSFLHERKSTQVNLEKSSTITKPYDFPLRLAVLVGPNRSRKSNSRGQEDETIFFALNDERVCLPLAHALQILSKMNFTLGNLFTRSCRESLDMTPKLACPNRRCHNHSASHESATKHKPSEDMFSKSTV